MLDIEDTGYEGKFDFPATDVAPRVPYMLASIPRTGSTFLSHLLWRTGYLGAPLEYLNFDGPYAFAASSNAMQQQLWRSVLRRRTSPNGVFGAKCFPMQLQALAEANPALLTEVLAVLLPADRPRRIVYLERRDRLAHSVSYARATISGVWRKEQETGGAPEPEYSEAALETAGQWIDGQSRAWEAMFRDLAIDPLRLWYEDTVADPEGTVRRVAGYLGVAPVPGAEVRVPEVQRQSAGSPDWTARHGGANGSDPG